MVSTAARSRAASVWLSTVARPVAARALPTWAGVAIVAGVVMGGNGLMPRDVAAIAGTSPRAWAVVAGAWVLLTAGAVRAAIGAPGTSYLRSLPTARGSEVASVALAAAAVHLPWAALW